MYLNYFIIIINEYLLCSVKIAYTQWKIFYANCANELQIRQHPPFAGVFSSSIVSDDSLTVENNRLQEKLSTLLHLIGYNLETNFKL